MSKKELSIRKPDDFHVHLRRDAILDAVLPCTMEQFGRALIMPNTDPKVMTAEDANTYYWEIETRRRRFYPEKDFHPLMSIYLTEKTTPEEIFKAHAYGVVAGKLYPDGATTNSQGGISDVEKIYPVLEAMERGGMVLSIHAEEPKAFCMDRETAYLNTFWKIYQTFPKLKIVWEHITTKRIVELLERYPNRVAGTITVHHLILTLDDVIGDKAKPHNFCKPVAKRPEDREALIKAATSGNPKFFFGSDSAPHWRSGKETGQGAAGVFTAPVAMPLLAQIFEEHDALDKLEAFTSEFGALFYRLPMNNNSRLILGKGGWQVPYSYPEFAEHGIVPFMAGEILKWRVKQ